MHDNLVLNTLSADAFVAVNKRLLQHFKGDALISIVLAELIAMYRYYSARGMVDEVGFFPAPMRYLEQQLYLSSFKQHRALSVLQAANFLTVVMRGSPSSRYVVLHFEAIASILSAERPTSNTSFYAKLTKAAMAGSVDSLSAACDNMKYPLKGAVIGASLFYTSMRPRDISDESSSQIPNIEWTPKALGLLKYIVKFYAKESLQFDYIRLKQLFQASVGEADGGFQSFMEHAHKIHKRIYEISPQDRRYSIEEVYWATRRQ